MKTHDCHICQSPLHLLNSKRPTRFKKGKCCDECLEVFKIIQDSKEENPNYLIQRGHVYARFYTTSVFPATYLGHGDFFYKLHDEKLKRIQGLYTIKIPSHYREHLVNTAEFLHLSRYCTEELKKLDFDKAELFRLLFKCCANREPGLVILPEQIDLAHDKLEAFAYIMRLLDYKIDIRGGQIVIYFT